MAYETEKNRLASIITSTVGINRIRDNALEREASERAVEASHQTGMNVGSADGEDLIIHPTAAVRRERLGVPVTVGTAELATWNYLYPDPVARAAQGLLDSPDHRAILNNGYYDHWGIGIHTVMPAGQTNELLRRWWFIIWLSNVGIEGAAMAQPTQTFSPAKYVSFAVGTYHAYKFTYDGKVAASKSLTLTKRSSAHAKGRGKIPNRSGDWLLMADGAFADYWLLEGGFFAQENVGKLV